MSVSHPVLSWLARNGRRIGINILGFSLLIGGIVGLFLPVIPGWLLIIPGLAVLGREYLWARKALAEAKRRAQQARAKVRRKKKRA